MFSDELAFSQQHNQKNAAVYLEFSNAMQENCILDLSLNFSDRYREINKKYSFSKRRCCITIDNSVIKNTKI